MRRITALIFFTLIFFSVSAQKYDSGKLRQKCLLMRRFLELNHYKPLAWNDSSSSLLFDKWINSLDEYKQYFIKTDMDELNTYRYKLDDEMLGKSWGFFDRSINIYRMRLQETDSIFNALTAKPFDFSKPDNVHMPFASYAVSVQDLAQRYQRMLKWKILDRIFDQQDESINKFTAKIPANFASLESAALQKMKKQHVARMHDELQPSPYFEQELENEYLKTISWCYDPHTEYMNISAEKEFETELSRFEYSVGIDVDKDDNGEWKIQRLVPGSTAWRSGDLHEGDILLKIKSGDKPEKELEDMDESEVLSMLEGASDDKIVITLRTSGGSQKTVVFNKEKIEDDESIVKSFVLNGSQKIGYIKLPGFYSEQDDATKDYTYEGCANDVAKEVVKLKKDTIQGLILDLRYNGGGSIWEALQLAGIFIDQGPICSTKDKDGKVHFLKDPNRGTIYDGPMIVMINGQSASASELVSAVLQDYHRALIVGSTTYGKGSAQVVMPLDTTLNKTSSGEKQTDFVKVTDEKFYRVDGSTTQWKGVSPDISLPDFFIPESYTEKGNRSALLPDNSKAAIYQALPELPIARLQQLSTARVNVDEDFIEVKKLSDMVKQLYSGMDVPLQWSSFYDYSKKIDDLYAASEKKNESASGKMQAQNNSFDIERISLQSKISKEINDAYLERISKDEYIRESFNILHDWISIKL